MKINLMSIFIALLRAVPMAYISGWLLYTACHSLSFYSGLAVAAWFFFCLPRHAKADVRFITK
jgi:hypothetical protein